MFYFVDNNTNEFGSSLLNVGGLSVRCDFGIKVEH